MAIIEFDSLPVIFTVSKYPCCMWLAAPKLLPAFAAQFDVILLSIEILNGSAVMRLAHFYMRNYMHYTMSLTYMYMPHNTLIK